ncbi:SRPBCC family protein [Brevibacterium sp. CS2]|uniref:SRPBCC family protein n=1 Tax=Brevibacterium sp. CS2 TaxID=2575923 RepID=UPI0010C78902|nr:MULTISPECIES: SRPBCC family protein [Actinomycetes]MCX0276574.1 SRPBCC family protein [Nocardia zapadnayensis]QCP06063.1 SRPBCC family protein [Brevibacterium sp. CS2]
MRVRNRQSRDLDRPAAEVAALLSTLGTRDDGLWPVHLWFPMRLDGPPLVGAAGGHGPVRYHCTERSPDAVTFAFDSILGSRHWRGFHRFVVVPSARGSRLVHDLELRIGPWRRLQWAVLVGPLHDAVLEDLLDRAAGVTGPPRWSPWVRLLRRVYPRIRARGSAA